MSNEYKKYYLYMHIRLDTNLPFYIGIGTKNNRDLKSTFTSVIYRRAYSKYKRNSIWKNIINKTDYIVKILIESNDYNYINNKEIEYIKLYGRKEDGGILANLDLGGKSSVKSESFKIKLGLRSLNNTYAKGKVVTRETRNKISESIKNYYKSLSEKEKVEYNLKKGTRKNIKNKTFNPTEKWFIKKEKEKKEVIQMDVNNNIIGEYKSLTEAALKTNSLISKISQCCNNKRNTHNGFIWIFKLKSSAFILKESSDAENEISNLEDNQDE